MKLKKSAMKAGGRILRMRVSSRTLSSEESVLYCHWPASRRFSTRLLSASQLQRYFVGDGSREGQREFAIRSAEQLRKWVGRRYAAFIRLYPPKVRRGHKACARGSELNQIRSTKRSCLGSVSRTQTRFRGDIPNHSSALCTTIHRRGL